MLNIQDTQILIFYNYQFQQRQLFINLFRQSYLIKFNVVRLAIQCGSSSQKGELNLLGQNNNFPCLIKIFINKKCIQENFQQINKQRTDKPSSSMSGIILKQLIEAKYRQNPKSLQCLNFQNYKISKIGILEKQLSYQVKMLNISNNSLKKLEGIEQFAKLQFLNLCNNKISSENEMLRLKNLPHLKKVFFQANSFLQTPLSQELLKLLNSYENDMEILNYAYFDQGKQSAISQYRQNKSSKSPSLSSSKPFIQNSPYTTPSRASFQNPFNSKLSQQSKVNMILSKMQQFIQQKQQSQQISNQSVIDKDSEKPASIPQPEIKHQNTFKMKKRISEITPEKKSPNFGQSSSYQPSRAHSQFTTNLKSKRKSPYLEQSTSIKHVRKLTADNYISQQEFYQQASSSADYVYQKSRYNEKQNVSTGNKQIKPSNMKSSSPERNFKYQVNNLKINLEADTPDLNYPSIIEKQDQHSYEIQFDFMSPKKSQSIRKSPTSRGSPSHQLKQLTASYMKMGYGDQIEQKSYTKIQARNNKESMEQISLFQTKSPKAVQIPQSFKPVSPKSNLTHRNKQQKQQYISSKVIIPEQNLPQFSNMPRRKSLYQSTRQYAPKKCNQNTYYQLLTKFISTHNNSKSFTKGQQISFSYQQPHNHQQQNSSSDILSNQQNFQKFYYNSLIRLKPTFNLLYSPFYSLKVEQKDILLQELFKNHKQIFMLLIKQFYSRQKLQQKINRKAAENYDLKVQIDRVKQKSMLEQQNLSIQNITIQKLQKQNSALIKQLNKFQGIINSRQKLINDVQIEYQKANKIALKKDQLIQKFLNQDQIQEKIIQNREKRLVKKYLKIIQARSNHQNMINLFVKRRQLKEIKRNQRNINQLKKVIFEAFRYNYKVQKNIKNFVVHKNNQILHLYFTQWKIQARNELKSKKIQQRLLLNQKKQFIDLFRRSYLKSERMKKTKQVYEIRLQRKILENLRSITKQSKRNQKSFNQKALKFAKINTFRKYFGLLHLAIQKNNQQIQSNINHVKKSIIFNESRVFMNLLQKIKRDEHIKSKKIQNKIINKGQIQLFYRNLSEQSRNKLQNLKNAKIVNKFKLRRIFNLIKKFRKISIKKDKKIEKIARNLAQQLRIKRLITDFKEYQLSKAMKSKKQLSFINQLSLKRKQTISILKKKLQLTKFLKYHRGFKSKYDFLMHLRFLTSSKQMKNRIKSLQQHYVYQQNKYKQGHQLNIGTIQNLKQQVYNYLNEIQFSKIQIQKLSQRELFIMEEKQDCLLELKSRQEENLELKTSILEYQRRLQQLERKYEKALDMYSQAAEELSKGSINKAHNQSLFLYDSIAVKPNNITPMSFRKENRQTNFTSLKR